MSDAHGGSHGLQGKSCAAYDESLRVPFYVMLQGQSGAAYRSQMCSMVDVFRFIVELASGGPIAWASSVYKDQANRQSLLKFIFSTYPDNLETRTVSINGTSTPYILSTSDEIPIDAAYSQPQYQCSLHNHVICLRTKSLDDPSQPATYYSGSKYSLYSKWVVGNGPNIDGSGQQIEFYDYTNLYNRLETGNDYSASSPSALQTGMATALGNGPPSPTGLVASELMVALTGNTRDGAASLASITTSALSTWNNWASTALSGFHCSS